MQAVTPRITGGKPRPNTFRIGIRFETFNIPTWLRVYTYIIHTYDNRCAYRRSILYYNTDYTLSRYKNWKYQNNLIKKKNRPTELLYMPTHILDRLVYHIYIYALLRQVCTNVQALNAYIGVYQALIQSFISKHT